MTEGWMDPLPGVNDAFEVVGKGEVTLEVVEPTPLNSDDPPPEPEPVELDPEAADARLSAAAQEIVVLASALIHNSKSDVFVRKEDVKNLRKAVGEFELAYAETVTIGKLIGLAQRAEMEPALGDNQPVEPTLAQQVADFEILDAEYGNNDHEADGA